VRWRRYACDSDAGIYFEDNEGCRVVSTRPEAKVYYVSVVGGKVVEKVLEPESIAKSPDQGDL
jgi:dipeptidase E